jgi:hypothetical protein
MGVVAGKLPHMTADAQPHRSRPRIELHPAGTPDERLQGAYVIYKRDSRIAVYWTDLVPRTSA